VGLWIDRQADSREMHCIYEFSLKNKKCKLSEFLSCDTFLLFDGSVFKRPVNINKITGGEPLAP
jgi:molybdenum cofactor biosynthesis enzyme MoaA